MASNARIVNISNGFRLKRSHADRAIRNCAAAWVEMGVSIRSLTLAESIDARKHQAVLREPLPFAEIHGLRFEPPSSGVAAARAGYHMVREAVDFAASVAH